MTVSTTQSQISVSGNGATVVFDFPFIAVSTADIAVIYTDSSGQQTTLTPSQYLINLNPVTAGALWSVGGSVTYPLTGSPIAAGTTLTIQRILPLTQETDISNQGDFYPTVTEQALDTLCMEIQQVSGRTGQMRGTWVANVIYNFGDIVQDGVNGANTQNYYLCAIANTSSTWAADLANGDWALVIQSTIPVATLPLSIGNGGTGESTAPAALAALDGVSLGGANAYTGANNFTGGSIAVPTASPGDNSTKAASTAFVAANSVTSTSPNFLVSATLNSHPILTQIFVQKFFYTGSTQTYTPTTGMIYAVIEVVGGGGGGGGAGSSAGRAAGSGGGGGGYARLTVAASTIGSSKTVTVGVGGTAGSSSSGNGGAGGTTSVGTLVSATGGGGGGGFAGSTEPVSSVGAVGPGGVGTNGDVNVHGGSGTPGYGFSTSALAQQGAGGSSYFGAGAPGDTDGSAGMAGTIGTTYGGGGSGGSAATTPSAGGAGAPGVVIITEYISN